MSLGVPGSVKEYKEVPGNTKVCKGVLGSAEEYETVSWRPGNALECQGVQGSVMEYFVVPVSAKGLSSSVGMCMEVPRSANKSQRVPVRTRESQGIPGNI